MSDAIKEYIASFDELREQVKENEMFEGLNLNDMVVAAVRGNMKFLRSELSAVLMKFNNKHRGIFVKAFKEGAKHGKRLL